MPGITATPEKIFPTILIALQLCACVPYFMDGDWRRGTYWIAAAVLTTVVTW